MSTPGGSGSAAGSAEGESKEGDCNNTYDGCYLTTKEKNDMLNLDCDSVITGNPDFGKPVSGKVNYELFIAKCPNGCHDKGNKKVFGVGIHSADASICKSAIYDWSMPTIGGVIGVGITPGLGSYQKGKILFGIEAFIAGPSEKSFYTVKIDNYDMAELNMRIVDDKGLPAAKGRLEFRN